MQGCSLKGKIKILKDKIINYELRGQNKDDLLKLSQELDELILKYTKCQLTGYNS